MKISILVFALHRLTSCFVSASLLCFLPLSLTPLDFTSFSSTSFLLSFLSLCVSRRVQALSSRRSWGGGRRNWQPAPVIQGWSLLTKAAPTELHVAFPPSFLLLLSFFIFSNCSLLFSRRRLPTTQSSWRSCGAGRNSSARLRRKSVKNDQPHWLLQRPNCSKHRGNILPCLPEVHVNTFGTGRSFLFSTRRVLLVLKNVESVAHFPKQSLSVLMLRLVGCWPSLCLMYQGVGDGRVEHWLFWKTQHLLLFPKDFQNLQRLFGPIYNGRNTSNPLGQMKEPKLTYRVFNLHNVIMRKQHPRNLKITADLTSHHFQMTFENPT